MFAVTVSLTAGSGFWKSKLLPSKQKVIQVQTGLKRFTLTYSRKSIHIKGHLLDLNLDRKKCNAHILDQFKRSMMLLTRNLKKLKKTDSSLNVRVYFSGQSYSLKSNSKLASRIISLPLEVQRMKFEEKFICSVSKKI